MAQRGTHTDVYTYLAMHATSCDELALAAPHIDKHTAHWCRPLLTADAVRSLYSSKVNVETAQVLAKLAADSAALQVLLDDRRMKVRAQIALRNLLDAAALLRFDPPEDSPAELAANLRRLLDADALSVADLDTLLNRFAWGQAAAMLIREGWGLGGSGSAAAVRAHLMSVLSQRVMAAQEDVGEHSYRMLRELLLCQPDAPTALLDWALRTDEYYAARFALTSPSTSEQALRQVLPERSRASYAWRLATVALLGRAGRLTGHAAVAEVAALIDRRSTAAAEAGLSAGQFADQLLQAAPVPDQPVEPALFGGLEAL